MPMLSEALRTFLKVSRSPQTNRLYTLILEPLVTAIGPNRLPQRVSYEDLIDYLATQQHLKRSSLNVYVTVIKSFFKWCVDVNYIKVSPALGLRHRKQHKDPTRSRAIPSEDLRLMVAYARVTSPRNYALLLFMIDTGCRVGGIASLTIDQLDLVHHTATLIEKGEKPTPVFFGDTTANALRAWLSRRPECAHRAVWTGRAPVYGALATASIADLIRRLSKQAGCSREWGPHAIRHAVGHAYARAKLPVTVTQRKLGHSSPAITTENYYPDGYEYVAKVSRRYELLALLPEDEQDGFTPRLIPKTGSD